VPWAPGPRDSSGHPPGLGHCPERGEVLVSRRRWMCCGGPSVPGGRVPSTTPIRCPVCDPSSRIRIGPSSSPPPAGTTMTFIRSPFRASTIERCRSSATANVARSVEAASSVRVRSGAWRGVDLDGCNLENYPSLRPDRLTVGGQGVVLGQPRGIGGRWRPARTRGPPCRERCRIRRAHRRRRVGLRTVFCDDPT